MHSRMRPKYKPTINGKEVDLDLLYQIVTSHGGWEKVNLRNEWDDLLEHFHLPRGTNGGLVIKQIYLKYLERYEKIYFLGEDGGHGHKDDEDDYDDIRNRRRTASKMTSRSSTAAAATPSATPSFAPGQGTPQSILNPLSDAMRDQFGLSKRMMTDYDKLVLSLQSPLPNEQDMALSVCTLLCNETKHVIRLSKCPPLLTHLLAHTGIYPDCGLRHMMEETYAKGREMDLTKFWDEMSLEGDVKGLLCEAYVKRIQGSLGYEDGGEPLFDPGDEGVLSLEGSEAGEDPPMEEEVEEVNPVTSGDLEESTSSPAPRPPELEENRPPSPILTLSRPRPRPRTPSPNRGEDFQQVCCAHCPCAKNKGSLGGGGGISQSNNATSSSSDESNSSNFIPPSTLARSHDSHDKESKRVHQVALILRNLSFEDDNAQVMAQNVTMLRFLLLTANCSFGSLMQYSLDTISNVAKHLSLEDPSKDPISSFLLSSIISGLFSEDRMKVICSLDTIRNLTRTERNEKILANLMEKKVCDRLCELLTLCDIMMLIYTLECIHALSGIGESVCNEIVGVKGAVASFIALVTVEAQSYGPKGCIQMRVVETFTGGGTGVQGGSTGSTTASSGGSGANVNAKPMTVPGAQSSPAAAVAVAGNSIQAIGLRTVSGQTVVPPSTPHQPVVQVQPQPQTPAAFANSPSPLCGTVAAISVSTPTHHLQHPLPHRPPQVRLSPQVSSTPTSSNPISGPTSTPQISGFQVLHPHISSPTPSPLSPSPASPQPPLRSSSPGPVLHTHIAQLQQGKSSNCLPGSGPMASSLSTNNQNHDLHVTTTPASGGLANNIDHGHGKSSPGALPQVSSHSLTQQVFYSPANIKAGETLSEEAWTKDWLNGGFEQLSGTSIEVGELYRMYSISRTRHYSNLLTQEELIKCVKLVYGASVGPVVKNFGSTSLSFIDGIRPKINFQQNVTSSVPISNTLPLPPPTVHTSSGEVQLPMSVSVATNGVINDAAHNNNNNISTGSSPVSVGASASSPLSPILKATLSRPPTPKSPTGPSKSGRAKHSSKKEKKVKVKESLSKMNSLPSKKKETKTGKLGMLKQLPLGLGGKVMSPSSSAIRSLLASKVAQRQQKKLQQAECKNSKKTKGVNAKGGGGPGNATIKMNGEASNLEKGGEESSASSSMNSIAEEILLESKMEPSNLTFQGVLCNGGGDTSLKEESHGVLSMEMDEICEDDLTGNGNTALVKGMLVDLLERKVAHKETANGIVGREIRISDKGLELIQNQNQQMLNSDTASLLEDGASLISDTLGNETPISGSVTESSDEPQKMTFYASPEVLASLDTSSTTSTSSSRILLSGGSEGHLDRVDPSPEIVIVHQSDLEIVGDGDEGASITFGDGGDEGGSGSGEGHNNIDSNGNDALSSVGNDLFEKFSQFSDLIVVNPEQLRIGVKRSSSTENSNSLEESEDHGQPPNKKICVNGNDEALSSGVILASSGHTRVLGAVSSSGSVLHSALSGSSVVKSSSSTGSTTMTTSSTSTVTIHGVPNSAIVEEGSSSTTTTRIAVNNSGGGVNNPQMVHLPVRLLNAQNSQQISFAGRQMVIQPGQQIVLSSAGGASGGHGLSGQVIISKQGGAGGGDAVTKAYILIPQQNPGGGTNSMASIGGQIVQTISMSGGGQAAILSSPAPTPTNPGVNPIQVVLSQVEDGARDGIPPHLMSHLPIELLDHEIPYLCEWSGCGYRFLKQQQVFMHAVQSHCPEASGGEAIRCEWGANGCDPLMRKRFSIMTHIQDRHCNRQALELALYRRKNKIEPPPPPQQPIHHPGYAPNAAFHAIKRHALQYMNPKDLLEENEGPVTKSIRLTSALILRNLVNFSPQGRRIVAAHESQLSTIAMSSAESSRTVSQLLFDMNESTE